MVPIYQKLIKLPTGNSLILEGKREGTREGKERRKGRKGRRKGRKKTRKEGTLKRCQDPHECNILGERIQWICS